MVQPSAKYEKIFFSTYSQQSSDKNTKINLKLQNLNLSFGVDPLLTAFCVSHPLIFIRSVALSNHVALINLRMFFGASTAHFLRVHCSKHLFPIDSLKTNFSLEVYCREFSHNMGFSAALFQIVFSD